MKKILFYFVVALCCSHLVYAAITEYTISKVWCGGCHSSDGGSISQQVTNRADSWGNAVANVKIPSSLRSKCSAKGSTVTCDIRSVDDGRRFFNNTDCINNRDLLMSTSTAKCTTLNDGSARLDCLNGYTWMPAQPNQGARACRKEHTITFSDPLEDPIYNPNAKINISVLPAEYQSYCTVININTQNSSFECKKFNDFWNEERCVMYRNAKGISAAAATCNSSSYVPSVTLTCKNGLDIFDPTVTEEESQCVYETTEYKWSDSVGSVTKDNIYTTTSLLSEAQSMNGSSLFPQGTVCSYDYDTNTIECKFQDFLSKENCLAARNDVKKECKPSGRTAPDGTVLYALTQTTNSVQECDPPELVIDTANGGTSCVVSGVNQ